MNTEEKAFSDLKRFAQSFSGVLKLAEDMANVGSVKQAADEARIRVEQLAKEEKLLKEKVKAVSDSLADIQKKYEADKLRIEESIKSYHQLAKEAADAAAVSGADLIEKAKVHSNEIVSNAEFEAAHIVGEAKSAGKKIVDDALSQKSKISNEVAKLEADKLLAIKEMEEAKLERDRINEEIDELLSSLKRK